MSAVVYIEGGGDRDQNLERLFRRSWTKFFQAAGLDGHMPRVIRGGGRNRTFDLFATAIQNPRPGRVPFLLVDSEAAVVVGPSAWQHLHDRDNWDRPQGARDDQMFLMVQVMETWLLADRAALREYFGAPFRENALRQWPELEDLPKPDVLEALARATAGCPKTLRQRRDLVRTAGDDQPRSCRGRVPTRCGASGLLANPLMLSPSPQPVR